MNAYLLAIFIYIYLKKKFIKYFLYSFIAFTYIIIIYILIINKLLFRWRINKFLK